MTTEIVILGAGYSGLLMALRLARTTRTLGTRITLVDASPFFADRIRQHELSVRTHTPRRIDTLARSAGIRFVHGHVTAIDATRHQVQLTASNGTQALPYDRLIYALGSHTDLDAVPGIRAHARTFSRQDTVALRGELPALAARNGRVLVCGGGLTGIEAASEMAEAFPGLRITLATRGRLGAGGSEKAQRYLRAAFERLNITLRESTRVTGLEAACAQTSSGPIGFDLCLWAGPFTVPALAREAGLRVNNRGQALVDGSFQSISHADVMVVGDAAAPAVESGAPWRMACATSTAMGAHAADALAATLRGQTHPAFRMAYVARNTSLGRRDGVIDWVTPDDRPRGRIWTGRLAAAYKNMIGALVWRSISHEHHRPAIYQMPAPRSAADETMHNAQHYAGSK